MVQAGIDCYAETSIQAKAVSVVAGARHACAVLVDGRVSCWGDNESSQCGGEPYSGQVPMIVAW